MEVLKVFCMVLFVCEVQNLDHNVDHRLRRSHETLTNNGKLQHKSKDVGLKRELPSKAKSKAINLLIEPVKKQTPAIRHYRPVKHEPLPTNIINVPLNLYMDKKEENPKTIAKQEQNLPNIKTAPTKRDNIEHDLTELDRKGDDSKKTQHADTESKPIIFDNENAKEIPTHKDIPNEEEDKEKISAPVLTTVKPKVENATSINDLPIKVNHSVANTSESESNNTLQSTENSSETNKEDIHKEPTKAVLTTETLKKLRNMIVERQPTFENAEEKDHLESDIKQEDSNLKTDEEITRTSAQDSSNEPNIIINKTNCHEVIVQSQYQPSNMPNNLFENDNELNVPANCEINKPVNLNGYETLYNINNYGQYHPSRSVDNGLFDYTTNYRQDYTYVRPPPYPTFNNAINLEIERKPKYDVVLTLPHRCRCNEILTQDKCKDRIWRSWQNTQILIKRPERMNKPIVLEIDRGTENCRNQGFDNFNGPFINGYSNYGIQNRAYPYY